MQDQIRTTNIYFITSSFMVSKAAPTLIEVACTSEIYWSSVWSPLVGCPLPNEISERSKSKIILAWQNSSFLFPLAVNYQTLTSIKCACAGRKKPNSSVLPVSLFIFFSDDNSKKAHTGVLFRVVLPANTHQTGSASLRSWPFSSCLVSY